MLSILCVSKLESFARPFIREMFELTSEVGGQFVLATDGVDATGWAAHKIVPVKSSGYIESVLDVAVAACDGEYVLRLDDDERVTPAMKRWLTSGAYRSSDHWKFATANMWDCDHFVVNPPLWPDHHTRLSVKAKAGGRRTPHAGSPFGGGKLAPVIFEHHKFRVKSLVERRAIAARYDAVAPGLGTGDGLRCFSLPELCFDEVMLAPVGDGELRELNPDECVVRSTVFLENARRIEGWMTEDELRWLGRQALLHRVIVEVGSWCGRSARVITDNMVGGDSLYCVDPWRGFDGTESGDTREWLAFNENLGDRIRLGYVVPVRVSSLEYEPPPGTSMVFLDGCHFYEHVRAEIKRFWSRLPKGGVLCGHDYWNPEHPGVTRAVDEAFFGRVQHHGSMWWVTR